jgi:hypothetical protein
MDFLLNLYFYSNLYNHYLYIHGLGYYYCCLIFHVVINSNFYFFIFFIFDFIQKYVIDHGLEFVSYNFANLNLKN